MMSRVGKFMMAAGVIFVCYAQQISGQEENCQTPSMRLKQQVMTQASKQPELGVDYSKVARFKLISRKTTYHMGEMITLDLAMLNIAGESIFFNELSNPELQVVDDKGKEVKLAPYFIAEGIVNPKQYTLLKPWHMVSDSVQLLSGCDERAFKQASEGLDDEDEKRAFDNNQFINWGRACLKITRPGIYKITAMRTNQYVVVSSCEPETKTAIGTMRSAPLIITVIE
jgi:hypothetical protein